MARYALRATAADAGDDRGFLRLRRYSFARGQPLTRTVELLNIYQGRRRAAIPRRPGRRHPRGSSKVFVTICRRGFL